MSIQAVLFDLDNTLTHRDKSIYRYAHDLAQSYQMSLDANLLTQIIQIIQRIDQGGYPKKEMLTHKSIGTSVAYALLNEVDWKIKPSLEELSQFWFERFGKNSVAMDGAENLLRTLKKLNLKLAIISNGGHATRLTILKGLGFEHYFDIIMSSEKMGVSKPNAEIFTHTCQLLNVKPENCLFVGDHPINDIRGANCAGLHTLLLTGFHFSNDDVGFKISHLNEVLDFI
ncbi:HAD family hydrolase [Acinetobacter equi]|uniref:Hydrolase n=1 Tax=Acinetobacter equi TaxID=1324350 RepID=A0A0N9VB15_9GAMM|nr:HAD family hydrolase [Acinetobacter equi]ALH94220.1 hydrolase [Acinetobacter equi]